MTTKQFFKSVAFKSIVVMMVIVIICGGIIAICNSLFYVSPEEVTLRAVTSIFGKEPESMTELVLSEEQMEDNMGGYVNSTYYISDEGVDYLLINSTGDNGYQGGSITMWVLVSVTDASFSDASEYTSGNITGLASAQYSDNTAQTLMSSFNSSYYSTFTDYDDVVASGGYFTTTSTSGKITTDVTDGTVISPTSGATYSSVAIVNAINTALYYAYGGSNV